MRKFKPVTPGELLVEEFLKPLGSASIVWQRKSVCRRSALVRS
jgi:hypothetical protein